MTASPTFRPSSRLPVVPSSIGDVIDRLTILDLKFANLAENDPRREHVVRERGHLRHALTAQCEFDLEELFADDAVRELAEVNRLLWDVEDDIRRCLAEERFDEHFIDLARRVPTLNDRRSALKYRLNRHYGSDMVEVKSYAGFEIHE
jgi:hypothetical protein